MAQRPMVRLRGAGNSARGIDTRKNIDESQGLVLRATASPHAMWCAMPPSHPA
jgi:hypothetical protein